MFFLTVDEVFLTVAVTGVFFLVEIGIFILAGMIWSKATVLCCGSTASQLVDAVIVRGKA